MGEPGVTTSSPGAPLLDRVDAVPLGHVVVVALVDDRDDRSDADDTIVHFVDDFCVLEDRLQLADPAFHVTLLVLGGVVVAVLGEVAELPGPLDRLGDLDASACGEVFVFGLQPLVGRPGQLVGLRHALEATGWPWAARRQYRLGP